MLKREKIIDISKKLLIHKTIAIVIKIMHNVEKINTSTTKAVAMIAFPKILSEREINDLKQSIINISISNIIFLNKLCNESSLGIVLKN